MGTSKKLDNILDECLERLLIKGESIEQCLQSYPEHAEELKPLLDTIVSARQVSDVEPSPEFRARARYQFRSALQEAKAKKGRRFFGWQPAWATVVAVVATFILASGATVGAAGNSMPEEPLYPVKVATEQLQLMVTRSPVSKAELYAKLADRRVAEIIYLASKNKPEAIESTTQRLNTNLIKIAALSRPPGRAVEVQPAPEVLSEAARGEEAPPVESSKAPREVAPAAESPRPLIKERAAAGVSPQEPEERAELSKQAQREPDVRLQRIEGRAELRAIIARYAKNHPEKLREALKKAPPSVRQALRRAIAISEARYEEASRALEERKAEPTEQTPPKALPKRPRSELAPQKVLPEKVESRAESSKQVRRIEGQAELRAIITRYVKNHPEKLPEPLKNVLPSVRQAWNHAIVVSEAGHENERQALD